MLDDRRLISFVIAVLIIVALLIASRRLTSTSALQLPAANVYTQATALAIDRSTPIAALSAVSRLDPGGTLTILWRSGDLRKAVAQGSVCVYAIGPGEICADYATGEVPAEALMNQVEIRGYTPRSG